MKGIIHQINSNRGMVAIFTENGDYSIFELLSNFPVEIGDEVLWKNDTGMGSEVIKNITKNVTDEVFFQNHHVSKNQLAQQLLL